MKTFLETYVRKPKFHDRIHNTPPLIPILIKINPVHILPSYIFKIHFNIILPSTATSSKSSLLLGVFLKAPCIISLLFNACHMPCQHSSSWFDNPGSIYRRARSIKHLVMGYPANSYCVLPLRSRYSPQHPILENQLYIFFFPNMRQRR